MPDPRTLADAKRELERTNPLRAPERFDALFDEVLDLLTSPSAGEGRYGKEVVTPETHAAGGQS